MSHRISYAAAVPSLCTRSVMRPMSTAGRGIRAVPSARTISIRPTTTASPVTPAEYPGAMLDTLVAPVQPAKPRTIVIADHMRGRRTRTLMAISQSAGRFEQAEC
jgi:hypothetical protein